jgi:hypothetical protein
MLIEEMAKAMGAPTEADISKAQSGYFAASEAGARRFIDLVRDDADFLVIVLKSHLLIEEQLHAILRAGVRKPELLADARLQFSTTMHLAHAIVGDHGDVEVWPAVAALNKVRNALGHVAEPENLDALRCKFFSNCEQNREWKANGTGLRDDAEFRMYCGLIFGQLGAMSEVVRLFTIKR